jgi:phosphoribosylformylglycinamidine synthase
VALPGDPFTALFSESAGRALVAVRSGAEAEFAGLCLANEVPAAEIGLTGGPELEIAGCFSVPVAELSSAYRSTLPAIFG